MTRFLVAIHRPNDYDPSSEDETMAQGIDALNEAMVAAGIRVFVGGLQPTSRAKTIRIAADGGWVETDGPCLDASEHVGGFWVLELANPDEAMAWGRRAAEACRASVEVRPFH